MSNAVARTRERSLLRSSWTGWVGCWYWYVMSSQFQRQCANSKQIEKDTHRMWHGRKFNFCCAGWRYSFWRQSKMGNREWQESDRFYEQCWKCNSTLRGGKGRLTEVKWEKIDEMKNRFKDISDTKDQLF